MIVMTMMVREVPSPDGVPIFRADLVLATGDELHFEAGSVRRLLDDVHGTGMNAVLDAFAAQNLRTLSYE